MPLTDRVQAILLKPRETWPVIAAEDGDVPGIFSRYVMILAAIPALAGFIGTTVFGVSVLNVTVRVPIVSALLNVVVVYLLTLVTVYVLSLIVDALAPTFGGTRHPVAALKVVAYSMTAVWVAGILGLVPSLGALGLLIGAVGATYLLYTGLPVLMRAPDAKAGVYAAVVVVCGFLVTTVFLAVSGILMSGALGMNPLSTAATSAAVGDVTIKAPDGSTVTLNGGAMTDMAKRMEEAGKRLEAAQKSGDPAATQKAMSEVLGAVNGTGGAAIAADQLKALLPATLGDLPRTGIESTSGQTMGIGASTAKATYAAGDRRVELSIIDSGGLAGLAGMVGWANVTMDKDADGRVEKVYKDGGRTVHEQFQKDGSQAEMTLILGNGVIVEAEGSRVDMASLKKVVAGLDVGRIESIKRAAK